MFLQGSRLKFSEPRELCAVLHVVGEVGARLHELLQGRVRDQPEPYVRRKVARVEIAQ